MLFKRNLLESVTLGSCCGAVVCILLNYVTNISPITGPWFAAYIFVVFVGSLILSIKFIQWLLHLNKPLKYDVEAWVTEYPWLGFLRDVLPQVKVRESSAECREYDTNELSVISTVLERKLVSSWYVPYISEEIGFPFACKQLLDQMITKTFQICHKIETRDVYVDMCAVLITHLKEYKKALKRQEKSPTSSIESLYNKTHPIFDVTEKKLSSADHCVNILRIILKELVPWELWDTPHSELLIRVLAKKLDNYIDSTLCEPAWLNDKLFMILKGKSENETKAEEPNAENTDNKVDGNAEVVKEEVKSEPIKKEPVLPQEIPEPAITTEVKAIPKVPIDESREVVEKVNNVVEEITVGTEPVEIKPTAILRQKRGRQGRNEVKIYDRIIEGSVKTWETDMDLQCISVGQDLLASLDEMTLSRLWGQEDAEHSPNLRNRSPQPLWFGEEDSIDIEHEPTEARESKKESAKPTEALLKDLQSTVHQAKTKIGDLQVPLDIDVPCKHSSDEAAGMMEGLLDIGIAGIKKGLRFTGLSDDSQEKSPSHHKDKGSDKTSPPESARSSQPKSTASEAKEIIPHVPQKEENGNAVPHLVKQHRVSSQDSVPSQAIPTRPEYPALEPLSDSPEPEYEEVGDLSTSIAKLRSLLQETSNASRSDEIWWEGAEETRGRAQPPGAAHRAVDTASLAYEYDMSGEPNSSPRQTSNNMQRLDKLFQRTVTGVFNSIKTAVSAEDEAVPQPAADWTYIVAGAADNSVSYAVSRLLGARRGAGRVDAALDPLLQPPPHRHRPPPIDFEEWCAGPGAAWSGGGDAACAAGLCARHVPYRLATLLCADMADALISSWLSELTAWLRERVFAVFQQAAQGSAPPPELRPFQPADTCRLLRENIPDIYAYIFGEDTITEAISLIVASFSHKQVNKDVIYRALDLFAVHFKKSAGLRNPSFDNN
ncbi:uncharacterized protein [Epargyreus clarus]|uniref:uncharacterized protein n=1 Tax=Epargyreus clarus TaxID=520877 RepID=UPI003C2CEB17